MTLNNPLGGVRIGTFVDASGNFKDILLSQTAAVTQMRELPNQDLSMRGESNRVYTSHMNQMSASFSGSYGLSGIAKLNGAVSAYIGRSDAHLSKTVSIEYRVMITGGIEKIPFDALTPAEMLGAMEAGPKLLLARALDAYVALTQTLDGADLVAILSHPKDAKYAAVRKAYDSWATAAQNFRGTYGEAIVTGVLWGGIGSAVLTISDVSAAESWHYGVDTSFTYSGFVGSASVGASYDASGSSNQLNINVKCDADTLGACAKVYTDPWFKALHGQGFKELTDVDPLQTQPLPNKPELPKPPELPQPRPDQKTTDAVKKINKDGITSAAKAAAYDKWKKPGDPDLHQLDDFLKLAEKRPDSSAAEALRDDVLKNALSVKTLFNKDGGADRAESTKSVPMGVTGEVEDDVAAAVGGGARMTAEVAAAPTMARMTAEVAAAPTVENSDYVPIGVWLCDWADLFPWVATGSSNAIDDTSEARDIIKFRIMQQDFLTLSKLYRYAATLNLEIAGEPNFTKVEVQQIADNFANQAANLTKVSTKMRKDYVRAAADAYSHLSVAARAIYDRWDEVQFLRNCELGLGLLKEGEFSCAVETGSLLSAIMRNDFAQVAKRQPCSFRPDSQNFEAFRAFAKLLPLILPSNGQILAFGSKGVLARSINLDDANDPRVTNGVGDGAIFFARTNKLQQEDISLLPFRRTATCTATFLEFHPNIESGRLEFVAPVHDGQHTWAEKNVKLYPIPFSAAKGLPDPWLGLSFSTSVASDDTFVKKLETLANQLEQTPTTWSFSGAKLLDGWTGEDPYASAHITQQYFGLIDDPTA